MRSWIAAAVLLGACDVTVSIGDHDAGHADVGADDAATLDAHPILDGAPDAHVPDGALDGDFDAPGPDRDAPRTDAPPVCHAPDGGACAVCQASSCCVEVTACAGDPLCPCIADCMLHGSTHGTCTTLCGGTDRGEHAPLVACAIGACAGACP